jgi:peroxiredoxin
MPAPVPQPAAAPPLQGLPLGSPAPAFELPDLSGARKRLADFRARKLLLIFFNPRCGFCTRMAPDLAALADEALGIGGWGLGVGEPAPDAQRPTPNAFPLPLVVTTGQAEESRKLVAEHGIRCPVLLQSAMEVASQYRCHGTPMGYLIDEQGRIASELATGGPALLALAADGTGRQGDGATGRTDGDAPSALGGKRSLEESRLQRDGLPAGTPAPDFILPLLEGGELSLSDYRGRPVLLVFSTPQCGPCDQLAPRLEQAARRSPEVQVLMVSRGQGEENRAKAAQHGLTFPIVLQQQWEISRKYGKFATPIGYLIDEEGIIAQEIALGVEPILSLLSAPAVARRNGKGELAQRR